VLGIPAYGYLSRSAVTRLAGRSDNSTISSSSSADNGSAVVLQSDDEGSDGGQISFTDIVRQGALVKRGGDYDGAGGFERRWDSCSSTVSYLHIKVLLVWAFALMRHCFCVLLIALAEKCSAPTGH